MIGLILGSAIQVAEVQCHLKMVCTDNGLSFRKGDHILLCPTCCRDLLNNIKVPTAHRTGIEVVFLKRNGDGPPPAGETIDNWGKWLWRLSVDDEILN